MTATIDQTFAALADPTRVEIVTRLSRGSGVGERARRAVRHVVRAVLKHVQVLEDAGLVRTVKEGRVRRCELEHDASTRPPAGSNNFAGGGSAVSTASNE